MKILKNNFAILIYALLTFFFVSFHIQDNTLVLLPAAATNAGSACTAAFLFLLYKKLAAWYPKEYKKGFHILAAILSAAFSFISVMGVFYSAKLEVSITALLTSGAGSALRFLAVFAGGFLLFYFAIGGLGAVRERFSGSTPKALEKAFAFLFGKKSFLKTILVMAVCWLPYLIIRFPGSMPVDGANSLFQYYGLKGYTTQHPIIYTQLLGRFCDLGARIYDAQLGLFLLVLVQVSVLLLVLGYTLSTMKKLGAPRWLCLGTLVIFSVVPVFPAYATLLIIDVFYSAAILLLMNELAWYLFRPAEYKKSRLHLILTAAAVLAAFFRQNGFYVMVVLILFIAARELYLIRKGEQTIRYTLIILAVFLLPVFAGKANNAVLHRRYNAKSVSSRAMLAVPIQQIARYITVHGDQMDPEDLASIQKVMAWDVEKFRENYNPYNFDGVKRSYQFGASKEELADFLRTWFKLFLEHPQTYLNATLHQNYCLFSPLAENNKYYSGTPQKLTRIKNPDFSKTQETYQEKKEINRKLVSWCYSFSRIPLLGLYVNQGIMTLMLLGICLYGLFDRNGRLLLLSLPLLLTLAVTFVGPAAYGHPRYLFPILYSMPLLFGLFLTGQGKAAPKNNHEVKK